MKCLIWLLLCSSLFAETIAPDPSSSSFEVKQSGKFRVDTFDFSGVYPQLENIDVDGRRKKNVEFHLTGEYPLLESVNYKGTFGSLSGELTGNFPLLSLINFMCTSCAMRFDLNADWQRSCEINITGGTENIVLKLPKNVGLVIHTTTAARGKVIPCKGLKKKSWLGIFKKTYENELVESSPIIITLNIALSDGSIILE